MTKNDTPEFALRIRVRRLPTLGEFDEDLSYFHVGQSYVLPTQLASVLILAGVAEPVERPLAEAADFGHPRYPRRR